ncbi:MAG: hypothetical protein DDT19_01822 [Syntrophomonadaceae bacterium]|nr:hypothetical protein [Bacillota bacterium]
MIVYRDMDAKLYAQDILVESPTQTAPLGSEWDFNDGRSFVYCKNGTVALAAGSLLQAAVPQINHLNRPVVGAHPVGATTITISVVGTAIAASEYNEGFLHINAGAGRGYVYKVLQHPAAAVGTTCAIEIYDAVAVALDPATSRCSLTKHLCGDVITYPAVAATSIPVGVTPRVISANFFFWAQVKGVCTVLASGVLVIGNDVVPDTAVAGAVMPAPATDIVGAIGRVFRVNAGTEHALINLAIPGF